jgi:molybdopterin-biosynthesis enzyme MoeA-like protein
MPESSLHDTLHTISNEITDIKTAIHASEVDIYDKFKRHIALVSNSQQRVAALEKIIDELLLNNISELAK